MQKELDVLGKALSNPERPFTAIIGGAKVKDKIGVIDNLLDKVDNLIIGGGLAYTFVKAQGHEIGKSLLEEDKIDLAKSFMAKAKEKGVNFYMPVDAVVADEFSETANKKEVAIEEIPADWQALDITRKRLNCMPKSSKNRNSSFGTDRWAYSKWTSMPTGQKALQKRSRLQPALTASSAAATLRQLLKNSIWQKK